jgi:hypothetical protein
VIYCTHGPEEFAQRPKIGHNAHPLEGGNAASERWAAAPE